MTPTTDPQAVAQVLDVASRTTDGQFDPLLACRVIAGLKDRLAAVPTEQMDFFVAVASECDKYPLGSERQYWAPAPLAERDIRAADYRDRIRADILEELEALVARLLRGVRE